MQHKVERRTMANAVRAAALLGGTALCLPSQALEYEFGEFLLNVDTTLGYSAQWRTESRDKGLEANINANDGNNNFDAGSMTSNKVNMILEVGGEWRNLYFFVRADALYDYVYADGTSDMSRDNYLSYNNGVLNGGSVERGDFPRDTVAEMGRRTRLLDAFVGYSFNAGDVSGTAKAGRQVISWGTTRFYPGVNGIQNPFDAAAALAPGSEFKEFLLPTSAVDLQLDLTTNLSMEAYYKFSWEETLQAGVGGYLSASDSTGPGAERWLFQDGMVADVIRKDKPDDDQWGVAVRYLLDSGWGMELAYTKSHSNLPTTDFYGDLRQNYPSFLLPPELSPPADPSQPDPFRGTFQEVYAEDVPIWSFGLSGNISEAEVYVDLLYSDDAPFIKTAVVPDDFTLGYIPLLDTFLPIGIQATTPTRGHYWQAAVGMTDVYTAFPWFAPSIALTAEVMMQGNNLGESDRDESPVTITDKAWGYQFAITPRWFNVVEGMDLDMTLAYRHDVDGYGGFLNTMKEDQKRASLIATANYLSNWTFGANYTWYFDENEDGENTLIDRDNFSISVKYRF